MVGEVVEGPPRLGGACFAGESRLDDGDGLLVDRSAPRMRPVGQHFGRTVDGLHVPDRVLVAGADGDRTVEGNLVAFHLPAPRCQVPENVRAERAFRQWQAATARPAAVMERKSAPDR